MNVTYSQNITDFDRLMLYQCLYEIQARGFQIQQLSHVTLEDIHDFFEIILRCNVG